MTKLNIAPIIENLPIEVVKSLGVIGTPQLASHRTIRFDLPCQGTDNAFLRVKITAQENGELRLRTQKVIDLEDIPGIIPSNIEKALRAVVAQSLG